MGNVLSEEQTQPKEHVGPLIKTENNNQDLPRFDITKLEKAEDFTTSATTDKTQEEQGHNDDDVKETSESKKRHQKYSQNQKHLTRINLRKRARRSYVELSASDESESEPESESEDEIYNYDSEVSEPSLNIKSVASDDELCSEFSELSDIDVDVDVDVEIKMLPLRGKKKYDSIWQEHFKELVEYKKQHGHCNVPFDYEGNNFLGLWVSNQRTRFRLLKEGKPSHLTRNRVEQLNKLGFEWAIRRTWKQRYNELVKFKNLYGHCNVPKQQQDKPGPQLSMWVVQQRTEYRNKKKGKPSSMTTDRIKRLEKIGFEWILIKPWEDNVLELLEFRQKYGHCDVPYSYLANPQLGFWVAKQRYYYRTRDRPTSYITPERIKRLEQIGFQWVYKRHAGFERKEYGNWHGNYQELVKFQKQYGHCWVPLRDEFKQLGQWVRDQRKMHRSSRLRKDRIELLEKIGFQWICWDRPPSIKQLKGERVTTENKNNHDTQNQPMLSISISQIPDAQYCSDLNEIKWLRRFKELKQFKKEHGHCNIPRIYEPNVSLGIWVQKQRQNHKSMMENESSNIIKEREEKLEKIGFVWKIQDKSWGQKYKELVKFKKQHGHCNVPRHSHTKELGLWVMTQRKYYEQKASGQNSFMTKYQMKRLREIDFNIL